MFLKNFAVILAFTYLIEAHRPKYDANLVPLIVGGVEATPYEFPWIVSIQRPTHSCGGSIINENWILTAGLSFKVCDIFKFLIKLLLIFVM